MPFRPRCVIALTITCCALAPVRAQQPQDNAADHYLKAVAMMGYLSDKQEEWIADRASGLNTEANPWTTERRGLMDYAGEAIAHVRRGEGIERCEWPTGAFDSNNKEIEIDLSQVRMVARLAIVRAQYLFDQDEPTEAIDEACAVLAMIRRIGNSGGVVSYLVARASKALLLRDMARRAPRLQVEHLDHILRRWRRLPATARGHVVMARDLPGNMRSLRIDTPQKAAELLKDKPFTPEQERVLEFLREGGRPDLSEFLTDLIDMNRALAWLAKNRPEQFARECDIYESFCKDAIRIIRQTPDDAEQRLEALKKTVEKEDLFIEWLTTMSIDAKITMVRTERRFDAQQAMFEAGLVFLNDGEDAFKRLRQPWLPIAFEFKRTDQSLTLWTIVPGWDDGISLTFGDDPADRQGR